MMLPEMEVGRSYTWDRLGELFGFKPDYLAAAGGMITRPELNVLLLITHPNGARTFDYEDRWDGDTLIYTGRGKIDEQLKGPNQYVAENRYRLLVFEAAGTRTLRFVGEATCFDKWLARSPDSKGDERNVWKFRLSFGNTRIPAVPQLQPRLTLCGARGNSQA